LNIEVDKIKDLIMDILLKEIILSGFFKLLDFNRVISALNLCNLWLNICFPVARRNIWLE